MIFESKEFKFTQTAYKNARKEIREQIKKEFNIDRVSLPWGALVLYGQAENGKWLAISSMAQDARKWSSFSNYKIKSLDLCKKTKKR